jgi:hypothetical protein
MRNLPNDENPFNDGVRRRALASAEIRDLYVINAAADVLHLEAAEVLEYQTLNEAFSKNR